MSTLLEWARTSEQAVISVMGPHAGEDSAVIFTRKTTSQTSDVRSGSENRLLYSLLRHRLRLEHAQQQVQNLLRSSQQMRLFGNRFQKVSVPSQVKLGAMEPMPLCSPT